jgi:hypothetical protein
MSRTIWKYPVMHLMRARVNLAVEMPKGAEILTLQVDQKDGMPCIWAVVDPDAEKEYRTFLHVGTGQEVPWDTSGLAGLSYVGTWQMKDFVFHTFEVVS